MRVELLRAKLYRGNHCDVGQVTDMDHQTASMFIEKGWARPYVEPTPITTAEAEELIPTKNIRRRALR